MYRSFLALTGLAVLAACDNAQPFAFGSGEEPPVAEEEEPPVDFEGEEIIVLDNGVPSVIAGSLQSANYRPGANTVTITGVELDVTPIDGQYQRQASLDLPGYVAYAQQDDPLDRYFVALAQRSRDGGVQGVVVSDGGQFRQIIGGANFAKTGTYTPYSGGNVVSYSGTYAGFLNGRVSQSTNLQTIPAFNGSSESFTPGQPIRIQGDVLINADFADNAINGGIANRRSPDANNFGDLSAPDSLPPLALVLAEVAEDGTFVGDVWRPDQQVVGNYAGTFGGQQASGVAIGLYLGGDFIPTLENEKEYGVIVVNRCGTPGEGPACAFND